MGADTPQGGLSGNKGADTPFDLGDGFRRFADHVPLMMWRTDEKGRSTYHNECWLQFTGRPLAEAAKCARLTSGRLASRNQASAAASKVLAAP